MSPSKSVKTDAPPFVSSEVPLYYQLGTILREKIHSGILAPGDQLPTEADLVVDYGVSRITVRQALKSLSDDKLIRREAGRGTFVTDRPALTHSFRMDTSLDDLTSMEKATSVELIDLSQVVATAEDAAAFEVDPGSPVTQCTRLRFHRGEPFSYIVNRLPQKIAEHLVRQDWEQGLILRSIQERLGLRLRLADQNVRATLADGTLARSLNTRIGAPLLLVDRVVSTEPGPAVERVHTYYRSDVYSLTGCLEKPGPRRPGLWVDEVGDAFFEPLPDEELEAWET
jgi:GntR family transcriptional regulator